GDAVVDADLKHIDDVRVVQAFDGFRLDPETGQFHQLRATSAQDQFQSDDAVGVDLPGLVDNAHAPTPEFAEDLVPGDTQAVNLAQRLRHGEPLRGRTTQLSCGGRWGPLTQKNRHAASVTSSILFGLPCSTPEEQNGQPRGCGPLVE